MIVAGFTYGKGSFSEAILWWVRIYNEFEGEITLNMLMFCELITKATHFKATGMISLIRIHCIRAEASCQLGAHSTIYNHRTGARAEGRRCSARILAVEW